jgi:hypothetical protein
MNALEELIKVCERYWKTLEDIDYWCVGWDDENQCIFNSDSIEIMKKFLEDNYSNYDNWWGCQELYWEIVFKDRTWLERWEYDWSEWWEYKKCPERRLSKDEARIKEINEQVDALLRERESLYNKNND